MKTIRSLFPKKEAGSYTNAGIVFMLSVVLFVGLTMPFRLRLAAADITDMRPTTALTPVLGLLFGLPAALGCGLGSLISDCISGYGFTYALIGAAQQILYGMVPWFLLNKINKEQDGNKFRLDCILRMLKFFLVMFVDAILIVILTGILINSFDSGLLFGCPLLIAGHGWKLHLSEIKTGIGTGRNGGH